MLSEYDCNSDAAAVACMWNLDRDFWGLAIKAIICHMVKDAKSNTVISTSGHIKHKSCLRSKVRNPVCFYQAGSFCREEVEVGGK